MKKYFVLFLCTTIVILLLNFYSYYFINSFVKANVMSITTSNVENTILCSGKIQYSNKSSISTSTPSIVDKIFVNIGDKVKEGDVILRINEVKLDETYSSVNSIQDIDNIDNIKEVYNNILSGNKNKTNSLHPQYTATGKQLEIKASRDGTIVSINTRENEFLNSNIPAVILCDNNNLDIELKINEAQIADIKIGQDSYITGVGFKDSEYHGVVTNISNEAEQVINPTGAETMVAVKVGIDSVGNDVKPGFTAKCKIVTSLDKDKIIIPYESICLDKQGNEYVYKYSKGIAKKTYIKTDKEYAQGVSVIDGININDKIILNPNIVHENCKVLPIIKNLNLSTTK